jgi:hypothetical protein
MTNKKYVQLISMFLLKERQFWLSKNILIQNKVVEHIIFNADEVPLILAKKSPKQVAKKNEHTQLLSPPIVGTTSTETAL